MDIKNLTNSPYQVTLSSGEKTMLPARGRLEGVGLRDYDLALLRTCGYIEISESKKAEKEPTPGAPRKKKAKAEKGDRKNES